MYEKRRYSIGTIRNTILLRLYDYLTWNDPIQSVDLIVVMAGKMERKQYGIELYKAGVAPRLLLSVGRFEVSKLRKIDIGGIDELVALRDKTPPDERHFFLTIDASGIRIENPRLSRWSTYGEALALRQQSEKERAHLVMIVSSDIHLRRVRLTFASVFPEESTEFVYCATPFYLGSLRRSEWWKTRDNRHFVLKEMMKLVGYRLILSMPTWARHLLMRVKH